jgi:hypothetical protein
MPRVREIDDPGDDPILKDIWEKERQAFGAPLKPPQLLALVYLRVSVINGCPF